MAPAERARLLKLVENFRWMAADFRTCHGNEIAQAKANSYAACAAALEAELERESDD